MSKFVLTRKLELDSVDDSWKGCYITFTEPNMSMIEKLSKEASVEAGSSEDLKMASTVLSDAFIEGKGWNGKEIVAITKEDLSDLPISVYKASIDFLLRRVDEQKKPSNASSE